MRLKKTEDNPGAGPHVGDSPYDIEATAQAGVKTVSLLCGLSTICPSRRDRHLPRSRRSVRKS